MKIISITIENIQSISQKTTIQFDGTALSKEGIFLICGPTGAGKSTILDAITLALFKETPRTGGKITTNTINDQGMVITRGAIKAVAEVIYEMDSQQRYRSTFHAERTSRSKEFSSGHLKMTLSKWNGGNWEEICQHEREVIPKNIEIIGLNANQFRMAVMLAQGDFTKLLKAQASERALLLEKITGKEIFRSLGKKIAEKHSAKKNEIALAEAEMGSINILSPEEKEQVNQELSQIIQRTSELEKIIHQQKSEIQWWENQKDLQQKINKLTDLLTHQQTFQNQFAEIESEFNNHEKAEKFSPILLKRKQFIDNISYQENQLNNLEKEKIGFIEEIEGIKKQIQQIKPDFLKKEDWLKELIDKKDLAQSEKLKFDAISNDFNLLKQSIQTYLERYGWTHDTNSEVWKTWKTETENLFRKLGLDPEKMDDEIQICSQNLQKAKRWLEVNNELLKKNSVISTNEDLLKNAEKEVLKWAEELKTPQSNLEIFKKNLEAAQLEVEGLQKIADASQIRATLKDGQPCVVCGSLEHPYAHQPFDDALENKIKERDSWNLKVLELSKKITELEGFLLNSKQKKSVLEAQIETWKDDLISHETLLQSLSIPGYESPERCIQHFENIWEGLKQNREKADQLKQLNQAEPLLLRVPGFQKQLQELSDNYFSTFPENFLTLAEGWINDTHAKKEKVEFIQKKQLTLKEELTKHKSDLQNLEQTLQNEIQTLGFKTILEVESCMVNPESIQTWRSWKNQLDSNQLLIRDLKQEIENKTKIQNAQPQPHETEEALKVQVSNFQEEQKSVLIQQGNLQGKLSQDEINQQQAGNMLERIQNLRTVLQHWNVLNQAFGDLNGDKFSRIAQQYTLDLLIQIANKKLGDFKARYILQQEKHPKGESHLVVVDQFLGNQIRSVDSLSGGEMFLTSLALAMALSEFAAQNAQLNTLFIDEGFGTLDPDALNAAMEAIDAIRQKSNKMVGLISHVQDLRERIHCQIEVKPIGNGLSTIELRP